MPISEKIIYNANIVRVNKLIAVFAYQCHKVMRLLTEIQYLKHSDIINPHGIKTASVATTISRSTPCISLSKTSISPSVVSKSLTIFLSCSFCFLLSWSFLDLSFFFWLKFDTVWPVKIFFHSITTEEMLTLLCALPLLVATWLVCDSILGLIDMTNTWLHVFHPFLTE